MAENRQNRAYTFHLELAKAGNGLLHSYRRGLLLQIWFARLLQHGVSGSIAQLHGCRLFPASRHNGRVDVDLHHNPAWKPRLGAQ